MTEDRLRQLEALCEATTHGQWVAVCTGSEGYSIVVDHRKPVNERPFLSPVAEVRCGKDWKELRANAEFLANAHGDVPELIAEVRLLKAENSDMAQLFNFLGPYIQWQRIGAAIAISPDEHAAYMKYLRPILKAES